MDLYPSSHESDAEAKVEWHDLGTRRIPSTREGSSAVMMGQQRRGGVTLEHDNDTNKTRREHVDDDSAYYDADADDDQDENYFDADAEEGHDKESEHNGNDKNKKKRHPDHVDCSALDDEGGEEEAVIMEVKKPRRTFEPGVSLLEQMVPVASPAPVAVAAAKGKTELQRRARREETHPRLESAVLQVEEEKRFTVDHGPVEYRETLRQQQRTAKNPSDRRRAPKKATPMALVTPGKNTSTAPGESTAKGMSTRPRTRKPTTKTVQAPPTVLNKAKQAAIGLELRKFRQAALDQAEGGGKEREDQEQNNHAAAAKKAMEAVALDETKAAGMCSNAEAPETTDMDKEGATSGDNIMLSDTVTVTMEVAAGTETIDTATMSGDADLHDDSDMHVSLETPSLRLSDGQDSNASSVADEAHDERANDDLDAKDTPPNSDQPPASENQRNASEPNEPKVETTPPSPSTDHSSSRGAASHDEHPGVEEATSLLPATPTRASGGAKIANPKVQKNSSPVTRSRSARAANLVTPKPTSVAKHECPCCRLDAETRNSFVKLADWMMAYDKAMLNCTFIHHGTDGNEHDDDIGNTSEAPSNLASSAVTNANDRASSATTAAPKRTRGEKLCEECVWHWQTKARDFCDSREKKLMEPFHQNVFPAPMFKMGGVNFELMDDFINIKQQLTTSKARMKDFARIPATMGGGKFQYLVGDKSASEKRWKWQDSKLLENSPIEKEALEHFALDFVAAQLPLGRDGYRIDPGFVMTHDAIVQAPHRDYPGYGDLYTHDRGMNDLGGHKKKDLPDKTDPDKPETRFLPWILHCPLAKEGMELNYWPEYRKAKPPIRIHIPFGTFLLTRVDAVHGGIFGRQGNIRLHIAYTPKEAAVLAKGREWASQGDFLPTDVINYHAGMGAPEAGQFQRRLDLLKEDITDYCDPVSVNDCNTSYPVTYTDPTYLDRLLPRRALYRMEMFENIKNV